MQNEHLHIEFSELIIKYLSGNAQDAEIKVLEKWVLADPANKQEFMEHKKSWVLAGMKENEVQVEVESSWQQVSDQLFPEAKTIDIKPKNKSRRWLAIAAIISILLLASFWLFQNSQQPRPEQFTSADQVRSLNLADGSQVTLNRSSSLTFLQEEEKRKVSLDGNAFFDVARDEQHPFLIQASEVEVEVLGTAFYVDARDEVDEIQVIVESGKVAVRMGEQEKMLTANQKAIFNKNTQILQRIDNDDRNFQAIKDNILVFEGTPMEEVVFVLNRQFDTNIQLENEALKDCLHDGRYDNMTLSTILTLLEETDGLEAKERGSKIVLTGSCSR